MIEGRDYNGMQQRGGAMIATGGFGCVWKPALECEDGSCAPEGQISKMLSMYHAKEEKAELERAAAADPVGLAMIRPDTVSICAPKPEYTDEESLKNNFTGDPDRGNECQKHIARRPDRITVGSWDLPHNISGPRALLNMPDAGKELLELMDYSRNMMSFLRETIRIFYFLGRLQRARIAHNDIKPDNILFEPIPGTKDDYVCTVIDFGLMGSFSDFAKDYSIKLKRDNVTNEMLVVPSREKKQHRVNTDAHINNGRSIHLREQQFRQNIAEIQALVDDWIKSNGHPGSKEETAELLAQFKTNGKPIRRKFTSKLYSQFATVDAYRMMYFVVGSMLEHGFTMVPDADPIKTMMLKLFRGLQNADTSLTVLRKLVPEYMRLAGFGTELDLLRELQNLRRRAFPDQYSPVSEVEAELRDYLVIETASGAPAAPTVSLAAAGGAGGGSGGGAAAVGGKRRRSRRRRVRKFSPRRRNSRRRRT